MSFKIATILTSLVTGIVIGLVIEYISYTLRIQPEPPLICGTPNNQHIYICSIQSTGTTIRYAERKEKR